MIQIQPTQGPASPLVEWWPVGPLSHLKLGCKGLGSWEGAPGLEPQKLIDRQSHCVG